MLSTSNQTRAGPSMSHNLVEHGSNFPTSPRTQQKREELERNIEEYTRKIREYENNRRARGKQLAQPNNNQKSNQKKVSNFNQRLLDEMITIEDEFHAKGFVYGLITETGKSVSGASDSLRAWWKDQVMFDRASSVQIEKYNIENALQTNLEQERTAKSTMELLMEISDPTLGSILSVLMQNCNPSQRKYPFEKGENPPWWPTADVDWWGQTGIPTVEGLPPYKKPHHLKKKWKAAVILGIVKSMSPNFWMPFHLIDQSRTLGKRMTAKERKIFTSSLVAEANRYCHDQPGDAEDEAVSFLQANGAHQAPPNSQVSVPGNVAPMLGNPFEAMQRPSAALGNNPVAWPGTVPTMIYPQQDSRINNAAQDPQIATSGRFALQYHPRAFSYNPMLLGGIPMDVQQLQTVGASGASGSGFHGPQLPFPGQAGGMPSAGGSQDQLHGYGAHMQFGFEFPSSNQGSPSGR